MKRFFCLIFSAVLALSLIPAAFGDLEGEPQRCIDLRLECNPSTGYTWQAISSDEEIAYVQDLGITAQEDSELVGAPATAAFRICGAASGEAQITFAYARSWEDEAPAIAFTVPVTVDEGLNVTAPGEIALPREKDTGWSFEMADGSILEVTDQGGDEGDQLFSLKPLQNGFEEITFTCFSLEGQIPGVFTYRVMAEGETAAIYEIEYTSAKETFTPAFQFTTTDLEGSEVTERIFAGHSLTVLNFWEPWCGPCVAEMPFLEQLSQEYADQGVQVIGVFATPNADEDVQAVLDSTGVSYPILRYVREFGPMQTGYVPTTVIVDGTGAIVYGPVAGALNYAGWCALVEELL